MEYIKSLVVDHTPPHEFKEVIGYDELSIGEFIGYVILMFKDSDGNIKYIDCNKHNLPNIKPSELIVQDDWLDDEKPRIGMFKFDDLSREDIKYRIRECEIGDFSGGDIEVISKLSTGFSNNYLFTIGDIIHETNRFDDRTSYVIDGVNTAMEYNQLGKIYLSNSPDWDIREVNSSMLKSTGNFIEDLIIELDTEPGESEIPVFVIGGTMMFLGDDINRINNREYKIDLIESRVTIRLIDKDGVIGESVVNDEIVDLDKLHSNEFISEIFDSSKTFVIFIKCEAIHVEYPPASVSSLPGRIIVSKWQYLPLVDGHKGLVGYSQRNKSKYTEVLVQDDRIKRYMSVPNNSGIMTTGIDPSDIVKRRVAWQAVYVRLIN